jgi:hypothetical protein
MLISFHYILHIFDSIIDCGPCWNSWQYPIERLCGMLLPLVHSKLYPYKNLANNVILAEKFNHLFYNSFSTKNYSNYKVFSLNNENEELYWPSRNYTLNLNKIKQLKHFYSLLLNIPRKNLLVI